MPATQPKGSEGGAAAAPTAPARRPLDAWLDDWGVTGAGGWRPAATLLTIFVVVWTTFQIVSYASIDLHPDLVEVYAWSRHPSPGYFKHPPMNALMAWAWFSVFPATDWAFQLMAMVNAALALFIVDLIGRRYLSGDKRLAALLLLLLTPFYQFHAERFSTNQVLLSTWPLATYAFLRAFQTRGALWGLAAGAAAAAAMLGKYYSIYLVAALPVAALAHPARLAYLKSPSPWLSIGAGLAVMAPNLYWLVTTGFQPFHYAFAVHGEASLPGLLLADLTYLAGAIGYVALPLLAWALMVRPSRAAIAEALWPKDPDRRMLIWLLAVPLLLPAITAPFLGAVMSSLWTMSAWFLLPIVLLAPAEVGVPRQALRRLGLALVATTAALLLAAPAIAWVRHRQGDKDGRDYYALLAEATTRDWRAAAGRPLTIVRGDLNLAYAATFYSPDHPDSVPGFDLTPSPWVTPARLANEGWTMICPAAAQDCLAHEQRALAVQPGARLVPIEVTRTWMGVPSRPGRFVMLMVPPRSSATQGP